MAYSPLEGVALLTRQLQALGKLDDGKALKRCVKAGIKEAAKVWEQTIPVSHQLHRLKTSKRLKTAGVKGLLVGPGYAKAHIRTIATINAAKNVASGLLSVNKAAYYVVQFVELGTRHIPAQPTLRSAMLTSRDAMETALRESLAKDVEKAAKTK